MINKVINLWIRILSIPNAKIFFLSIFSIGILFQRLGTSGLASFDDCCYAELASEMIKTGDWLTHRFEERILLGLSPFYIWMIALCFKLFGISEFWAKFPSALFGLLTLILIFIFVKKFTNDEWLAYTSFIVLLTTQYFIKYARHAMFDVTLTFFCLLALFAFLSAQDNPKYFSLYGISTAIAILTKNILGTFPILIAILYYILTRQAKKIFNKGFVLSNILILVLISPWYMAMLIKHGNKFIQSHFVGLVLERGYGSFSIFNLFDYFKELFEKYWPWLPFALGGIYMGFSKKYRNPFITFNIIWLFTILGVMSTAYAKKLWYIMPAFVPLAILSAFFLNFCIKDQFKEKFHLLFLTFFLFIFLLINIFPIRLDRIRNSDIASLKETVHYLKEKKIEIVAYNVDEWYVNNPMAFYNDYVFRQFIDMKYLKDACLKGKQIVCFTEVVNLPEIVKNCKLRLYEIDRKGRYIIFSNFPLSKPLINEEKN